MLKEEQINKGHIQTEESESNNEDGQSLMGSDPDGDKYELCPDCHGSGSRADNTCSSCNGSGLI